MDMNIRIYDNYEEKWLEVKFEDFDEAEEYVAKELEDTDFERYSIYELLSGYAD